MNAYAELRMPSHYVDMSQKEMEYDGGAWWKEENGVAYISRGTAEKLITAFSLCCSCWFFGGSRAGTAAAKGILKALGCRETVANFILNFVTLPGICARAWDDADGSSDGWCRIGTMNDQGSPIGP